MDKFFLTKHAIDRLIERCPRVFVKWPYLEKWHRDKDPNAFKKAFEEILQTSSENKSLINDTGYMAKHYWDKYGFDSEFKFFESQEHRIKLVFVKDRSKPHFILATSAPFEGIQKINKWAKTQTKEQKQQDYVMRTVERNPQFMTMAHTSMSIARHAIHVETHIKSLLFKMAKEGKTHCLNKLSNSAALHQAVLENEKYEFNYYKFKDAKALEVFSVRPVTTQKRLTI